MNPTSKHSETKASSKSHLASSGVLVLVVRGIGNCPSFKNRKRAIKDSRTGKLRTLTEGKTAKRMKAIRSAIVFELYSVLATFDAEIPMAARLQFLIHLLPPDDNWRAIPELIIQSELCEPGSEGFDIEIERLP